MQRYFIEDQQIEDAMIRVMGPDVHHIKNVMRFTVGSRASFVDTSGTLYLASLTSFEGNDAIFEILDIRRNTETPIHVALAQALIKRDAFELVLEKATELGVETFIPTIFERSIIKLDERDQAKKLIRYQTIAKEASEQSERLTLPKIKSFTKVQDIDFLNYDHVILCYEREDEDNHLNQLLPHIQVSDKVLVLIGPEGGLSEKELSFFKETRVHFVSLGRRILRSETAAIYVLSSINYAWGV